MAALILAASQAPAADMRSIPMSAARWPTKAEFLDATRQGEFTGIPNLRLNLGSYDEEMAPFTLSVKTILHAEYGVPALPDWKGGCGLEFVQGVTRVFQNVVQLHLATVTDTPPTFSSEVSERSFDAARNDLAQFQLSGGYCETSSMGKPKAHPYKAATVQLLQEFNTAMGAWAEAERGRRKTAYADDQRQRKLDADERAARKRALDQRQLDSERTRIEAEEKRRQQAKKPQVGG